MKSLLPSLSSPEELEHSALIAKSDFIDNRIAAEEVWSKFYDEAFENSRKIVLTILSRTDNLTNLINHPELIVEEKLLSTLRYMQRPSVSADDFSLLSEINTSSASKVQDSDLAGPALQYVRRTLNLKLFPWLCRESLDPTLDEINAAACAVSAIIADQRTKTAMRNRPSRSQEKDVREALIRIGFHQIPARSIKVLSDFPAPMELFSSETALDGA